MISISHAKKKIRNKRVWIVFGVAQVHNDCQQNSNKIEIGRTKKKHIYTHTRTRKTDNSCVVERAQWLCKIIPADPRDKEWKMKKTYTHNTHE